MVTTMYDDKAEDEEEEEELVDYGEEPEYYVVDVDVDDDGDGETVTDASSPSEASTPLSSGDQADDAVDAASLSDFLPPPPATKCPAELQQRINELLSKYNNNKGGTSGSGSFNQVLRRSKGFQNPYSLQRVAERYPWLDTMGTCFPKDDEFDHQIEADKKKQRSEMEKRREQERYLTSCREMPMISKGSAERVLYNGHHKRDHHLDHKIEQRCEMERRRRRRREQQMKRKLTSGEVAAAAATYIKQLAAAKKWGGVDDDAAIELCN